MNAQKLSDDLLTAVMKLNRYAYARDRTTDREPRTLTITDDEAVALLFALDVHDKQYGRTDI